jgi:hypothetical protein
MPRQWDRTLTVKESTMQTMMIMEYCNGGNLQKALQKDLKNKKRRLVRPFFQPFTLHSWGNLPIVNYSNTYPNLARLYSLLFGSWPHRC